MQDHSPPTLQDFVSFLNDAASFMGQSNENAIAVHCRGGKGRSGVMCCAWLLYTKECATADQAMAKFALSRTEMRTHGKLQGVETPSQKRYVYQVDQLLKKQNRCGRASGRAGGQDWGGLVLTRTHSHVYLFVVLRAGTSRPRRRPCPCPAPRP